MPRDNKTEYALLGLLSYRPMTGYDMRRTIGESIGFFWHESYGQIYPALRRLHEKKLVNRRIQGQTGKPDRHEYRITSKGRKRLREWLRRDPEPHRVRHELLLKLFFAGSGDPDSQVRHVESYRDQQAELLTAFGLIESDYFDSFTDEPNLPYWKATLSYGKRLVEARLAWAEETIAMLKDLSGRKSQSKKGKRK
jgi:DNA-binding PadR family transcriptional regulator